MQLTLPDWNRGQWLLIVLAVIFVYRAFNMNAYWMDILMLGLALGVVGLVFVFVFHALDDRPMTLPKLPWQNIVRVMVALVFFYIGANVGVYGLQWLMWHYGSIVTYYAPTIIAVYAVLGFVLIYAAVHILWKMAKEMDGDVPKPPE